MPAYRAPDTPLTRFVATDANGNGVTTPALLTDVALGKRVEVLMHPIAPGQRAAQQMLLGDRAATSHAAEHLPGSDKTPALADVLLVDGVQGAMDPVLTLGSRMQVRMPVSTVFVVDDRATATLTDRGEFWREAAGALAAVVGTVRAGELVAERVYRGFGADYCCGF